jgi:hypothetical protein
MELCLKKAEKLGIVLNTTFSIKMIIEEKNVFMPYFYGRPTDSKLLEMPIISLSITDVNYHPFIYEMLDTILHGNLSIFIN